VIYEKLKRVENGGKFGPEKSAGRSRLGLMGDFRGTAKLEKESVATDFFASGGLSSES